ncbi:response regulator [Oceanospirillum sanctuarii]|uniref:response regulator n=1 Tax=Oceanospirillum sanctuarii TaxID=1434821 RepID=UPI000A38EFFF|nr:response regulator [Oceanospirillum sanctuarii]
MNAQPPEISANESFKHASPVSTAQATVLIVDDSPIDISFLVSGLADNFAIIVANNGLMALELAQERQPDVILMDVSMPELDGYECCRQLKQLESTQHIEVIFVSAHNSVEEKIKGYDAGGSDYVGKPVIPDELQQKVRVAVEHKRQREQYLRTARHTGTAPLNQLTTAEEQSVLVEFMKAGSRTGSASELGEYLLKAIESLGLAACSYLNFSKGEIIRATERVTPLETDLLAQIIGSKRVLEDDRRLMIACDQVAVLIREMPEEKESAGRFRTHLETLIQEAGHFLQMIENRTQLAGLMSDMQNSILEVNQEQERIEKQSQDLFDTLLSDIHTAFDDWGLMESQEKQLLSLIHQSMTNMQQCYESGTNKDETLRPVLDRLIAMS